MMPCFLVVLHLLQNRRKATLRLAEECRPIETVTDMVNHHFEICIAVELHHSEANMLLPDTSKVNIC